MKALLQRVSHASVTVDGRVVGHIGRGFVVLTGVTHADTRAEAEWVAAKIAGLRVFDDEAGKMNLSLADVGGELLVVSQFTLYGDSSGGNRPSFIEAARPEDAEPLITRYIERLRALGVPTETGRFRAEMQVSIHNDGPVTILLER